MFYIKPDKNLLLGMFSAPILIWQAYVKNLNNFFVWLTLPFLLIASCFYLAFLPLYGLFLIFSYAQEEFDESDGWLLLFKIVLYIPSILFIAVVYYPAIIIGIIIVILIYPCNIVNNKMLSKTTDNEIFFSNKELLYMKNLVDMIVNQNIGFTDFNLGLIAHYNGFEMCHQAGIGLTQKEIGEWLEHLKTSPSFNNVEISSFMAQCGWTDKDIEKTYGRKRANPVQELYEILEQKL